MKQLIAAAAVCACLLVAQDAGRVAGRRELAALRGLPFFEISSVTGQGLDGLMHAMSEYALARGPDDRSVSSGKPPEA